MDDPTFAMRMDLEALLILIQELGERKDLLTGGQDPGLIRDVCRQIVWRAVDVAGLAMEMEIAGEPVIGGTYHTGRGFRVIPGPGSKFQIVQGDP